LIDSRSLTLLVEILDAGSLAQAARTLRVTRANVSYHLNQLERAVGVQLIRRNTRKLEATEVGYQLYAHGQAIANALLAADEAVQELSSGMKGRVRLSVPSGYGHVVMQHWLIEFKRLYPGIALQVKFENRVDDLMRDEIDLAIRILSKPPEALVAREIRGVRYVICASRAFAEKHEMPRKLTDLSTMPIVASAVMGQQIRLKAVRGNRSEELLLRPGLASEHFPFLKSAILEGIGIGIVPDYLVGAELSSGTVVRSLTDWQFDIFGTHMFILYMPNRHQTTAVRTLIEFISQKCAEDASSIAVGEAGSVIAPARRRHRNAPRT